jgi:hypothetical protein
MLRGCSGRWLWLAACVGAVGWTTAAHPCWAQSSPPALQPIADRNYNLDLYQGVVFGSPRLVAMGGAAFAVGEGASGLFTNAASAAIRPSTESGKLAITGFFNSYIPASGVDFNNNGDLTTEYRQAAVYSPGLLVQYGRWGFALNFAYTRYNVAPQAGGGLGVRDAISHVAVAWRWVETGLTFGAGLRGAVLNVYTTEASQGLFTDLGLSGELGAVWQPRSANLRLALAGALPVYAGTVQSSCDPNNCQGYILPNQAIVPWTVVLGTGWRFASSRWNQPVDTRYRDELQATFAFDLLVAGSLDNAYGIEEFAAKQLQPSGRNLSWSPRFGVEGEIIPGWLRIRGGTYFEPARFGGVVGRYHSTAGAEVRILWFHLHGEEYRISLSLAGDFAPRYNNAGASLGLWN